jgi:hypothetical protein
MTKRLRSVCQNGTTLDHEQLLLRDGIGDLGPNLPVNPLAHKYATNYFLAKFFELASVLEICGSNGSPISEL